MSSPRAVGASYVARWRLPRPDLHRLVHETFTWHAVNTHGGSWGRVLNLEFLGWRGAQRIALAPVFSDQIHSTEHHRGRQGKKDSRPTLVQNGFTKKPPVKSKMVSVNF